MIELIKNIFFNDIVIIIAVLVVIGLLIASIINKDVGKIVIYSFSLIFIIIASILKEMILASDKSSKDKIKDLTDDLNKTVEDKIEVIKDTSSKISDNNNEIKSEVDKIEEKINNYQNNLNNTTAEIEKSKESMEDKIKSAGFSEIK